MTTDKPVTAVIVERGVYRMGRRTIHADGTETKQDGEWKPSIDGGCVIVCAYDTETDAPIGEADIFSRFDTTPISNKIRSVLNLDSTDTPNVLEIFKRAMEQDNDDLCRYCPRYTCRDCEIKNWKDERDEDGEK
jgi:hypothetical protein